MPVHNSEIAGIFNGVADLLEIKGANPFRVRAYRDAARTVAGLSRSAAEMIKDGEDLSRLSGIGRDLAGKIEEIVETGELKLFEELKKELSPDLIEMMRIQGLGAKRVKALYEELGVKSIDDLRKAAEGGKVRTVEGLGEKTEKGILEELGRAEGEKKRKKLSEAEELGRPLIEYLSGVKGVKDIEAAGSYRRRRETVGDLDILVTCSKGSAVMDRFVEYEDVEKVISHGTTRSSVVLRGGFHVDLRVVPRVSYGAAMHYFTGSQAHNIAIRKLGVKKGLKINEYGVFSNDERVAGKTEKEVFDSVGLPFIPPELREDAGEIEAAAMGRLPELVAVEDIRGDLHAHTDRTDGHSTLEEMAEAARELGYEYLAITEHSKRLTMTKGLDEKALAGHIKKIDSLNGRLKGITLLKGIEVDILEDGTLDLDDGILKDLDLTVCSVHSRFNLSGKKQTERIIRAMDNRYFNILGHPSGRLINEREPYEVEMDRIIEAAAERGCVLEVNAHPERLDLTDTHVRAAREAGARLVVSTDAHSTQDLRFMRYGVWQARRGWAEKDDIINTRGLRELRKLLERK